ncbi:MAG: hypothetical protein HOC20_11565, partial [Chloroflexi bacterium]|nr:hypothetical protein [Chloroflexota bacterium]
MKRISLIFLSIVLIVLMVTIAACDDDDDIPTATPTASVTPPDTMTPPIEGTAMTVTVENLSDQYEFSASGLFNTPVGDSDPGPLLPGNSYEFSFDAGTGAKLSFATMFVQSNDLFYAPNGLGIELFDANGDPISGNITSQMLLWDVGTEVNEEPGMGDNQAPHQAGPNTGDDENGIVAQITDVSDGYTYPEVSEVISVTVTPVTTELITTFTVNIANVSTEATLGNAAVPLAPGIWVIHTGDDPLFTEGEADRGQGLEAIAEDGDPSGLIEVVSVATGVATPFAPGIWVVHTGDAPLFNEGQADRGEGLEALAEDGDASMLVSALEGQAGIHSVTAFEGPIIPGGMQEFSLTAMDGDSLSFATMFVQSNDLFYAPGENGIALFSNGSPISGDVTGMVYLWDAGTELNEEPG